MSSTFLTLRYWFSVRAIPFVPVVDRILPVAFAVITVAGIGMSVLSLKKSFPKPTRRAFGRLGSHLTWTGLFALLLWSFTYQGIPILSMRFFYVLWFAWFVWGFYPIYKYLFIEVPSQEKLYEERKEAEKWLPKKK
jgi:hypothetical protein